MKNKKAKIKKFLLSIKKGFSISEVLVVFVIMIAVTAGMFINENKNKPQKAVDAATWQIASQLRSLQNEAINGKEIALPDGSFASVCKSEFVLVDDGVPPAGLTKKYGVRKYTLDAGNCTKEIYKNDSIFKDAYIRGNAGTKFSFSAPYGVFSFSSVGSPITKNGVQIVYYSGSGDGFSNASAVCVYNSGSIVEVKEYKCESLGDGFPGGGS